MYSILNLTDLHVNRLLVLYDAELRQVQGLNAAWVIFSPCRMIVKDATGRILLDVNEN
jgi:hypothetical protein